MTGSGRSAGGRVETSQGQEALEREVRLLIGMSSISAFGASLFTYQRPGQSSQWGVLVRRDVVDRPGTLKRGGLAGLLLKPLKTNIFNLKITPP